MGASGGRGRAGVGAVGRWGTLRGRARGTTLPPPFKFWAFVDRIHYIGYRSLLIILLTGGFTGMVLGLPGDFTLVPFRAEAYLGPPVAPSLIPELGPVLAALMVTRPAGSALPARVRIMRITQQISPL